MENGWTGAFVLCAMFASAASAQQPAGAGSDSAQAAPETLESIVVTAEKHAETIQSVAGAVSALSNGQLQEIGATDFSDYFRLVPGLEAIDRGDGQKKYILRGLNSESAPNLAPIVQQYLDEFPLTLMSGAQNDLRLLDLERVEVLRGPQGTLYGSGSMGGTIRYITHKPDLSKFGGYFEATGSRTQGASWNAQEDGVVNVPIIKDELGARALVYDEYDSGFIENVITGQQHTNDTRVSGGRLGLRWDPTAQLDLVLSVVGQRLRSGDLPVDTAHFVAPASPFPPFVPWFPPDAHSGDLQVVKSQAEPTADDTTIGNVLANYDLGWGQITSSTTYYDRRSTIQQDTPELLGYGSFDITKTADRTASEELRLERQSGSLRWLSGFFYLHNQERPNATRQTAFLPSGGTYFIEGIDDHLTQEAIFGESSYEFGSRWTATVGVRIARYEETQSSLAIVAPPAPPGASEPFPGPYTVNEDKTTGKAELAYKVSSDALVYALASSGFRPGGFNSIAFNPAINAVGAIPRNYRSDSLWNYEIGWKSEILDRRLAMDAAAYYLDWQNIQVTEFDPTGSYSYEGNASKAAIYGLEWEIDALAAQGLRLTVTGAYNDAKLTQNEPGAGGPAPPHASLPGLQGDRLPDVPRVSGALVSNYEFPLNTGGWKAFGNAAYTFTGSSATAFRPNDALYRVLPSYSLLNLRAGAELGSWRITAFVDNVTDKRAVVFIDPRAGYDRNYVNRPRTLGLTLRRTF